VIPVYPVGSRYGAGLQGWGAAQEVREEGFCRSQVGLAFAVRLVQHEMWFNKWIICFYPAAGIGLDYTGRALKAGGGFLLLIVLKGNKNGFTAVDGADGLIIAIRRAGHCGVEVRGKSMKNKRKNTQQQDGLLSFTPRQETIHYSRQ
jgi:hypothetical protein